MSAPAGPPPNRGLVHASTALLLLFVAGRCLVPMDETDLFYNLRLGEIVVHTRAVPRTNLLSFTNAGYPDPNLAWVFQIVLWLAHRAGGIAGTVWLKTAFVTGTFALLLRVALRRGARPAVAVLALALAAWAAEPRFVERPHLVTFLGLGTLLLALERAEAGSPRLLRALVPLGLVWANGNSCFFLAPALLLLYAGGAWADRRRSDARRATIVAACLIPEMFATPSGVGVLAYVANHFRMPWLRPLQEYRAAEWPVDGPFFFLVAGVVLTTSALAILERRTSAKPEVTALAPPPSRAVAVRHLLPMLALACLGARRIRFVAEAALLGGPLLAAQLTALMARAPLGLRCRRAGATLTLGALAALTLWPRLGSVRADGRLFDLGIEADLVPTAAIDWIEAHALGDRLYNDLEVGSYLTWRWPRHPVFQDPRINGYPPAWHAFLRRADLTRDEWEAFLARYDVRAALISFPDQSPRAALFDPRRWALVHRASDALVFARRTPANRTLIIAEEIPLDLQFDASRGATREVPLGAQPPESPLPPCEWQRRLGDVLIERAEPAAAARAYAAAVETPACLARLQAEAREQLQMRAAAVALELDQPEKAVALLEGLQRPEARLDRGLALLALGRANEALIDLEAARAALPDEPRAAFGLGLALYRLNRPDPSAALLRTLIARWPRHFTAPEARRLLARMTPRTP